MKPFNFFSRPRPRLHAFRVPRRRGQGIIETGLVIIALSFVSIGILQYGLMYNAMLTLNNMAREGARFAAVRATDANVKTQLGAYLRKRARGTTISEDALPDTKIILTMPTVNARDTKTVRVTLIYDMKSNKQFLPVIVPLPDSWKDYRATGANVLEGPAPVPTGTP